MEIKNKKFFWSGIVVGLFLFVSYFIKFSSDSGANYDVRDSLLGVLIYHNIFVFVIYLLIVLYLIFKGIGSRVRIS